MLLNPTDVYCDDSGILLPWMHQRHVIDEWNAVAHKLKFRAYADKGSRYASRKRVSQFIMNNAALLGGSRKTDPDILTRRFLEQFYLFCRYLIEKSEPTPEGLEVLGTMYPKTFGIWLWLRSDAKPIIHLAGLQIGCDDAVAEQEADKERRNLKRDIIKGYEQEWQEVVRRMSYKLRDPNRLKDLQSIITQKFAEIEDQIDWLADS